MKRLIAGSRSQIALTAALALLMVGGAASAAQAADPPSSADKELCKQGGWENLTTSTGATFTNQGDCVAYAATGGVLYPTPSLTFTLSPCTLSVGGATFNVFRCSSSTVASGLMPNGTWNIDCSPFVGCGNRFVASDGTINDNHLLFCREDSTVTVNTTTAAGNPISASSTCSL